MEGLRLAAVLLLVTLCVQAEDQCQQPKAPGRCMGYMERYYFNTEKGACEQFIYGGCEGNENNFETLEACQSACPTVAEDPCQLPKVVGRCKAKFDRFYFNALTGTCQPFVYGGCGGNANNFETFEACQAACL